MTPRPPTSTLFPYTTLFRSKSLRRFQQIAEDLQVVIIITELVVDQDQALGIVSQVVLPGQDRKSTRLNSSHVKISYAVFCLKKKKKQGVHVTDLTKHNERGP